MEATKDILKRYFGYDSFRPGQERMVDAILAGRDALGVMPTAPENRSATRCQRS